MEVSMMQSTFDSCLGAGPPRARPTWDSVPWVATADKGCLRFHITMLSRLAHSPIESRQRAEGQRLYPHPLRQIKGALPRPQPRGLCTSWPLWPAPYSWTRLPRTHGPRRRHCFQECFLWRDTCLAGLRSRWPESPGSRASSAEARPASAACGPGTASAHNSPVTAPTDHLLQGGPCAPQNVWLIKTIMGAHTGSSFPAEVAELISTALSVGLLFCFCLYI